MAEASVSLALETLRDLLLEEGRFLLGVSGEVKALQTQLKEIKCFLKDADKQQHKSETVRNWIVQIRDLAYRAEDVMLEYASSDGGRRRGLKRLVALFSCYSLHQLGSEISDIKSELSRVTKCMQDYGIRSIIGGAAECKFSCSTADPNRSWGRKTFPSFEMEDCFVGKVDAQLIENLCGIQRSKRCMIVLDDLWETSHWDGLKHAFVVRNLKSKVLVTTRNQKVAEIGF